MGVREIVEDLENQRVAALVAMDVDALERWLDDDVVYVHAVAHRDTKDEYLSSLREGNLIYRRMDVSDRTIDVFGDIAIVNFVMDSDVRFKGAERSLHARVTTVWQVGDTPKWLAFQATPIPN